MKKVIKLGLVLVLCGLTVFGLAGCGCGPDETGQQLATVSRGDLTVSVSADGNLTFIKDMKMTFGTTGTITEINVKEGDWVTEGDVLARLDTEALELAVKLAEVDLAIAENSFSQVAYPYTYSTFAFDVPDALAAIADAKRGLKKAEEALDMELSFTQYWQVKQGLEQAEEKMTEAAQRLARGRGEDAFMSGILHVADFWTVRAAQLGVDRAQVALDMANDDLGKAVMVAPFDGIVAAVNIKEGDSVSAMDYATRTIVELVDPTEMELSAEVDEIDVPIVALGQRAIISVDALPGAELEGEVTSVSQLANEESGLVLYKIKVSFEVPEDSGLKAGMSATADIIIAGRSDVLLVPNRAIGEDSQGNTVVQVLAGEQVEERAVVTGMSDGYDTEIISGLEEGEIVLVERKSSSLGGFTFGE